MTPALLTALVVVVAVTLTVLRIRRDRAARREAIRQYQRREDTPAVRRLIADLLEDINVDVARRSS